MKILDLPPLDPYVCIVYFRMKSILISKREISSITIIVIVVFISTVVAIDTVGLDNGRLVSGEMISIVGYSLFMTVFLFFSHLSGIIVGDTPNAKVGLYEIGVFLGLAILTLASIPLMVKLTEGIHVIRRIPYVWISVTQLSFMAFLYIGMIK